MVFGGEGLFLAQMTGPGRVILQSMTKQMFMPVQRGSTTHSSSSGSGQLIGGVLKGLAKK